MTGPVLSRAEQRAFVLALLDVPVEFWWWHVSHRMLPMPVHALLSCACRHDEDVRRECLLAAADLLRPRYSWDEADEAARGNVPHVQVVRMITGEEP